MKRTIRGQFVAALLAVSAALTAALAQAETRVTVQPGESLAEIVQRFGVSASGEKFLLLSEDIVFRNRGAFINGDPNWLIAGATLVLPFEAGAEAPRRDSSAAAERRPAAPPPSAKPAPSAQLANTAGEDLSASEDLAFTDPDAVAMVEIESGRTSLEFDGSVEVVAQPTLIQAGTRVQSDPGSIIRIEFVDGTRIELGGDTSILIDEYPTAADNSAAKAKLKLNNGAVRIVTGALWKKQPDSFRLETPVAVVTVRGTDFVVRHCKRSCGTLLGSSAGVAEGLIFLGNETGSQILGKGEFGHISGSRSEPVQGAIPEGFMDLSRPTSTLSGNQGLVDRLLAQLQKIWERLWSMLFGD